MHDPPELMFWRKTLDCAGKPGWKVIVGKA